MTTTADRAPASVLASPVRRDLVRLLEGLPVAPTASEPQSRALGLTARALADRLGLHVTTVRFHVDQLIAAGLITVRDERGSVGRPKRHYVAAHATPGIAQAEGYRLLASMLAEAMASDDRPCPEEAGRRWVERHQDELIPGAASRRRSRTADEWRAKVDVVADLLARWGYAPRVHSEGPTAEITLTNCPLRLLAATNPQVACGVHGGVLRGTLAVLGEPDAHVTISPHPTSHACLARVTTRADFQGGHHD